jgi:Zn-dependent peptidase ImmA (M78 family)/DNA-binding XRE family transcriptional regulator
MSTTAPVANVAFITPGVLAWARARSGLSHTELAAKLKVDSEQIATWERGESHPPFDKAKRIAKELNIPFGFLFLSKPPSIQVPLPDLRTQADKEPLSLNFLEVVNDALVKQDWYRDFLREAGEPKLKFVGSFTLSDRPESVAADMRRVLGINPELRHSSREWGGYLAKLCERAENAGILVMRSGVVGNATRRKLSSREFQGFALSDHLAPVVFVNSEDYKAPQVFTLLHELAHLWIGRNAISNSDPSGKQRPTDAIELFCNNVAVETLVPAQEFEAAWQDGDIETVVTALARRFWVSSLVILRRAHELDKISDEDFFALIESERKKYKKQRASGGDYYRNVTSRMGSKFTKAVLAELRGGKLLYRDAARLLRLKVPTLKKFSEQAR